MIPVTLVGNLTADPELRFTPSGAAVASFTVAVSKRIKEGDVWKDGPSSFVRCSVWRQYAENVGDSLVKGNRVIVAGQMQQREYEDKDGTKKSVWECQVDDVGPALRYSIAKPVKAERTSQNYGQTNTAPAMTIDDPWNTPLSAEAPF
jgi:single-strand DNA-binding protein